MLGGSSTETCGGASCVRTAYNFLSLCNWKTMKTMTITNIKIHIHFIVPLIPPTKPSKNWRNPEKVLWIAPPVEVITFEEVSPILSMIF